MSVDFRCGEKSVNYANTNARAVMEMAGIPGDLWTGECSVPVEDLPGLSRRILRALNLDRVRKPFEREAREEQKPGQCRVVEMGITDEMNQIRLMELWQVVQWGIAERNPLTWG